MSKTNCINCGAAKDTDEIKCSFERRDKSVITLRVEEDKNGDYK